MSCLNSNGRFVSARAVSTIRRVMPPTSRPTRVSCDVMRLRNVFGGAGGGGLDRRPVVSMPVVVMVHHPVRDFAADSMRSYGIRERRPRTQARLERTVRPGQR